jgi:hypothetical protein
MTNNFIPAELNQEIRKSGKEFSGDANTPPGLSPVKSHAKIARE